MTPFVKTIEKLDGRVRELETSDKYENRIRDLEAYNNQLVGKMQLLLSERKA